MKKEYWVWHEVPEGYYILGEDGYMVFHCKQTFMGGIYLAGRSYRSNYSHSDIQNSSSWRRITEKELALIF